MEDETLKRNNQFPLSMRIIMAILSSFSLVIIIYFISARFNGIEAEMNLPGWPYKPFSLIPVLASTMVMISIGAVVFLLLRMNTTAWLKSFNIIALVVLVLAFIATLTIADVGVETLITLNLMHIAVAACTIYFFSYFNKNIREN